ncbi:hypothetical protein BIW11_13906 [Tropilaelaps mercedesae]|uniref:Uncharacterized protein n=1 Tax=Tropilaelaps mercedesae TaxID=418985 RepID=A0A1V9X089_9ACAR|nr:hypothetical protein BIW11_13906 [Tropilaelaps mercedesae]
MARLRANASQRTEGWGNFLSFGSDQALAIKKIQRAVKVCRIGLVACAVQTKEKKSSKRLEDNFEKCIIRSPLLLRRWETRELPGRRHGLPKGHPHFLLTYLLRLPP